MKSNSSGYTACVNLVLDHRESLGLSWFGLRFPFLDSLIESQNWMVISHKLNPQTRQRETSSNYMSTAHN